MCMGSDAQKIPETAEERMLANIGLNKLERYKRINRPIEDAWIKRKREQGRIRDEAARETTSQVRRNFGQADEVVAGQMQRGAGIGSGKAAAAVAGGERDETTSMALGQTAAQQAADDNYVAGLQDVVDLGRGQSADATSEMASVADAAAQQAQFDAQMSAERRANNAEGLGSAAGFATRQYLKQRNEPEEGSGQAWVNQYGQANSVFNQPIG